MGLKARCGGLALVLAAVAAASVAPTGAATANVSRAMPAPTSYLFVLQAKEGWATREQGGHWRLSLRGVSPTLLQFSDRPARIARRIPVGRLVSGWRRLFGSSPPNAALAMAHGELRGGATAVEIDRAFWERRGQLGLCMCTVGSQHGTLGWLRHLTRASAPRRGEVTVFIDDAQAGDGCVLGQPELFATGRLPYGYAPADGRVLPAANNAALLSIYGTTYGGNGVTTVGLPKIPAPLSSGSNTPIGAWGICTFGVYWPGPGTGSCTLGNVAPFAAGVENPSSLRPQGWIPADGSVQSVSQYPAFAGLVAPGATNTFTMPDPAPPARGLTMMACVQGNGSSAYPYLGQMDLFTSYLGSSGWVGIPPDYAPSLGETLDFGQFDTLGLLLGSTYGGDGVNTFGVPDPRPPASTLNWAIAAWGAYPSPGPP